MLNKFNKLRNRKQAPFNKKGRYDKNIFFVVSCAVLEFLRRNQIIFHYSYALQHINQILSIHGVRTYSLSSFKHNIIPLAKIHLGIKILIVKKLKENGEYKTIGSLIKSKYVENRDMLITDETTNKQKCTSLKKNKNINIKISERIPHFHEYLDNVCEYFSSLSNDSSSLGDNQTMSSKSKVNTEINHIDETRDTCHKNIYKEIFGKMKRILRSSTITKVVQLLKNANIFKPVGRQRLWLSSDKFTSINIAMRHLNYGMLNIYNKQKKRGALLCREEEIEDLKSRFFFEEYDSYLEKQKYLASLKAGYYRGKIRIKEFYKGLKSRFIEWITSKLNQRWITEDSKRFLVDIATTYQNMAA